MKKAMKKYLKIAASFTVVLSIFACGKETPLAPDHLQQKENLQKTKEQITYLTSKTKRLNKLIEAKQLVSASQQLITVSQGGTIKVGNLTTGISSITFNPGDVKENVNVNVQWDGNNFQAEFMPHGITFNNPVRIRLSFKNARLTGIDEDNLRIWYYNEVENIWELTGGTVNKTEKYVEGYITHFSRYAIGSE